MPTAYKTMYSFTLTSDNMLFFIVCNIKSTKILLQYIVKNEHKKDKSICNQPSFSLTGSLKKTN